VNYSVIWSTTALQQLAAIWLAATNRNAVTASIPAIDLTLSTSPHTTGVVVFDTVYEWTYPPLGVEFEVIDADCRVVVLSVWDTTRGRPAAIGN
jgi:hypothetical protein